MKLSKKQQRLLPLYLFIAVLVSWSITLTFWFNNVDLSYFNGYIGFIDPIKNFNLVKLVRGHMLTQFFVYIIFGLKAWPYYLLANIFHALAAVVAFYIFNHYFKDRIYSFIATFAVFVNVTYVDALFQGSFNQYYPVLLLLFLLAVLCFVKEKYLWFLPSIFMILGLLFRETMILLPMIFMIYLISTLNKKIIYKNIKYLIPLIVVGIAYFYVRSNYLGVLKSDLTDDAVQLRMSYIDSGRYIQLLFIVGINFFRLIAEQFFTFPIIYNLRELFFSVVRLGILRQPNPSAYLVAISGMAILVFLTFLIIKIYKSNNKSSLFSFAVFGYLWFIMMNAFIAFVLPFPTYLWSSTYGFDKVLSRYNYWGILGLGVIVFSLAYKYRRNNYFQKLVAAYILLNVGLIWFGGNKLYRIKHSQAKNFINTVLNNYDTFPNTTVLYYNFFQVNNLRDYVYDLTHAFAATKYSDVENFEYESTLSRIQEEIVSGNYNLKNIYVFDLDDKGYLLDKTNLLKKSFDSLNSEHSLLDEGEGRFSFPISVQPFSNFKYILQFDAMYLPANQTTCTKYLSEYSQDRVRFMSMSSIIPASMYGSPQIHPYVQPERLIDNSLHPDSQWQAGLINGEDALVINLGEVKSINGIAWVSDGKNATPQSYSVKTSIDNQNWKEVKVVTDNSQSSRIDYFDVVDAQYVSINVKSTLLGQPVKLIEVDIQYYSEDIQNNYDNYINLYHDMLTFTCTDFNWGVVNWITSHKTPKSLVFTLDTSGSWKTYSVVIVNYEPFSNSRHLLEEYHKTFNFEIPNGSNYIFRNVKLKPWQPNQ